MRKDGGIRWVAVTARAVTDIEGRLLHTIGVVQDITERRETEKTIQKSHQRFRGTFENAAVGVAHVAPDGKWLQVNARLCELTGYERSELLTKTFQDITHPDDLDADMGHELRISLPEYPVIINADMTRMAQVFLNLLNNAAKYSDQGGCIRLTAEQHNTDVIVSVRDTGIGIAADQLPHIFEMFAQVDHSLEKSQGGLGIGLSLVKRLVAMHGGSVMARSEGAGMGSEFIVRLPVEINSAVEGAKSASQPEQDSIPPLRILIVDDNRDSADSLSMVLKIMGNDTRTAYDGEEAVAAAAEFQPRVILLDIGLPKLNGYETCRRIREQKDGMSIVIIAQTGWGQADDRQRTRDAGFDHHMVKPVDLNELQKLLAELQATK